MRKSPLTVEEKTEFVARQLVDTRQTTKVVADIFKQMYPDSEIVYVKAGNVSSFRKGGYLKKTEREQYKDDYLVKVREVNDYHHAKDAYLNVVVGNIYNEKFNHNPYVYISGGHKYNLARIFEYDVERANWVGGHDGTIVKIKQILGKNDILYTVMPYENRGGFFDQQLMKKGGGQFPIKTSDPRYADIEKYGGYNKIAGAYFALVRSEQKNKTVLTIEAVPVYFQKKDNIAALTEHYENQGMKNAEVVIPKIKINTLLNIDGSLVRLRGRTGTRLVLCSGNQLCISDEEEKYIKKIVKFMEREKAEGSAEIDERDEISIGRNIEIYDLFTEKLAASVYNNLLVAQHKVLVGNRDRFIELSLSDQCHVLYEILKFFKCDRTTSDLTLIGGSKSAGTILMNKTIDKNANIKVINQSATGLFETVIDLTKL